MPGGVGGEGLGSPVLPYPDRGAGCAWRRSPLTVAALGTSSRGQHRQGMLAGRDPLELGLEDAAPLDVMRCRSWRRLSPGA